ncbi:MAG: ethanolamine ammonia-lyase subunit EutC [Planctomycetota bacterium]|nr:ethanolamine ammonia-lyase subunit EutC [Planctomycetota bacterium]
MSQGRATDDPWRSLRQHTAARIALGRAGGSLPTAELLKFSSDHAEARDAVHSELDMERLQADLQGLELPIVQVASRVSDRFTYLQRPDLGCELDDKSRSNLQSISKGNGDGFDIVLIVADGLSALAAQMHATSVISELVALLRIEKCSVGPLVLARFARVGLQDEIGHVLHARAALILLGERPGLGAADSLGAYLVFNPQPGNSNAQRNCVSNIRPAGLPPRASAETLHYLVMQSLTRQISGIELKDERGGTGRQIVNQVQSQR